MRPVAIKKLAYGYLVKYLDGPSIAACSNFADLIEWMSGHFAEAGDQPISRIDDNHDVAFAHPELRDNPVTEGAEEDSAKDSNDIDDALQADTAESNSDEDGDCFADVEDAEEVVDISRSAACAESKFAEKATRSQMDQRAAKLVKYLTDNGALDAWVKASYADIGSILDVTPPIVMAVIDHAKDGYKRMRVCRVMSGENQGNNFTFNQSIPEPGAQTEVDELTPKEIKVIEIMKSLRGKAGTDRFSARYTAIAKAAGLTKAAIVLTMASLHSKGIIRKSGDNGDGVPVWRFCDE